MKLWHLVVVVFLLALSMAVSRDQVGRVALVVFVTALGEVVLGTSAILMLFRSVGAFGAARSFFAHLEAMLATATILLFGGGAMLLVMWCGAWVVQCLVP